MISLPNTIPGRMHGSDACCDYTKFMNANGHICLSTRRGGFVVYPEKGWLGASPDA